MKQFKIGLQLFSIREEMAKDMKYALQQVKEIGYDYVEFAGYYGKSAEEIKEMLDEIGLECISVHQAPDLFLEEGQSAVDYLKILGAKYCAIPWYDPEKLYDCQEREAVIKKFVTVGELLKKNGIQMLYHNHDFEFAKLGDRFLLDFLYETIPADILQTELDTCWVNYAGANPVEYLLKYTGRATVLHLKDFVCEKKSVYAQTDVDKAETDPHSREENGLAFRPLGQGMQDFPSILQAAEKAGTEYLIIEQDRTYEFPCLEAVRMSREYLKTLGI